METTMHTHSRTRKSTSYIFNIVYMLLAKCNVGEYVCMFWRQYITKHVVNGKQSINMNILLLVLLIVSRLIIKYMNSIT